MADSAQEEVIQAFENAAGQLLEETLAEEETGAESLNFDAPPPEAIKSERGEAQELQANTAPRAHSQGGGHVAEQAATKASGGAGVLGATTAILESGLGIVPLALELFHVFEGGSKPQPTFEKYEMPESIEFRGDSSESGGIGDVDFDQIGNPRVYNGAPTGAPYEGTTTSTVATEPSSAANPPYVPEPDTQAIPPATGTPGNADPQWFIDNAAAITAAVRSQMLNLNSINDMISDL